MEKESTLDIIPRELLPWQRCNLHRRAQPGQKTCQRLLQQPFGHHHGLLQSGPGLDTDNCAGNAATSNGRSLECNATNFCCFPDQLSTTSTGDGGSGGAGDGGGRGGGDRRHNGCCLKCLSLRRHARAARSHACALRLVPLTAAVSAAARKHARAVASCTCCTDDPKVQWAQWSGMWRCAG